MQSLAFITFMISKNTALKFLTCPTLSQQVIQPAQCGQTSQCQLDHSHYKNRNILTIKTGQSLLWTQDNHHCENRTFHCHNGSKIIISTQKKNQSNRCQKQDNHQPGTLSLTIITMETEQIPPWWKLSNHHCENRTVVETEKVSSWWKLSYHHCGNRKIITAETGQSLLRKQDNHHYESRTIIMVETEHKM